MVILKGSNGRFDPRFVAHIRFVFIQLKDEVGLMMGFHDLFEIVR